MAIAGKRVTVTTSPTALTTAATDSVAGQSLLVRNAGAAVVDLGGATVAAGAGFELAAGAAVPVDTMGETLYAVAASGTVIVHVLEAGL